MTPNEIIKFYRDNLTSAIGNMGYSNPPDDFSGVIIGGKTYPVMMRNDGCYVWFDEKGKKHALKDTPRDEYEFTNIKDARVSTVRQCYRTPGGEVDVKVHTYMNNKGEVLMEKIIVVNSTDIDIPIDSVYDKIPGAWVAIDCHIAEMTDRELVYVNKCYSTPGGKVQVEGVESVDPKLALEIARYSVLQSTDPNIPAGREYTLIPATWVRMVCDFPDMTQREIIPITQCYDTDTGRIKIEGYKVFDYILGNRKEWYRIKESTDPKNPVGKIITSVDDDWEQVVCDFTDMEDRDIEITIECYSTPGGKVKTEVATSWDGNIGVRNKVYKILESTDQANPQGVSMTSISDTWKRVVCDFTDMEDRDVKVTVECYTTPKGKVKIEAIRSWDGNLGVRTDIYKVLETTDSDNAQGKEILSLPSTWKRTVCDFTDMEDRNMEVAEECFKDGTGKTYKVEAVRSYDGNLGVRTQSYRVMETDDASAYPINKIMASIPSAWTRMECAWVNRSGRMLDTTETCYFTGVGTVKIRRQESLDGYLNETTFDYIVIDSSDPNIAVDSVPTQNTVNSWRKINCDIPDMTMRDVVYVDECYTTTENPMSYVRVVGYRNYDPIMGVRQERLMIADSGVPSVIEGTIIDSIPVGWGRSDYKFPERSSYTPITSKVCFVVDGKKCEGTEIVWRNAYGVKDTVAQDGKVIELSMTVIRNSEDPAMIGRVINDISSYTKIVCDIADMEARGYVEVDECYKIDSGANAGVVHIKGYRVYDPVLGKRKESYFVADSTSAGYAEGKALTSIPSDGKLTACDFMDRTQRLVDGTVSCYKTSAGAVYIREISIYDGKLTRTTSVYKVVRSSDPAYAVGTYVAKTVVDGWTVGDCNLPDMEERHMIPVRECYRTSAGRFYVEGYRLMNNSMVTEMVSLFVAESSDPAYPEGTTLTAVPSGATRIPCLCQTC